MISFFDAGGELHPLSGYEDWSITHEQDGCDTMTFFVNTKLPQYRMLYEECRVVTDGNDWLIKKIDDDRIDCSLNFDFLKTRVYQGFRSETKTLTEVLESHLPAGWIIEGASLAGRADIRRTIEFDFCTDYDIVYQCMNTYSVRYVWHILEKRLTVIRPDLMQPTGEYLTAELNLKSLAFKGDSVNFATRLYAYGKENMTIEDATVDGKRYGLTYVEDRSYIGKTVCAYWSDDRYTNPDSLYEDARKKLTSLSFPVRSYECDVNDMAKKSADYSFLDFDIHKKITLVDSDRSVRIEHQIVRYTEYPDEPDRNKVIMSSVPETIQGNVNKATSTAVEEAKTIGTTLSDRIMMATAMLNGAFGSYPYQENGNLYMMDNPDRALAKVVWRWNVNGFGKSSTGIDGPYTTALTFDDSFITNTINAMVIRGELIEAGSIKAGSISQSYSDDILSQSYTAANGLVEAMFQQISNYLSNTDGTGELDVLQKTITSLRQTIDGLQASFTSEYQGGINYIRNSSALGGITDDWGTSGIVDCLQNADTKNSTVANSCFRLMERSTLYQNVDNIISGNTYCISLKAKKGSNLSASIKIVYDSDKEAVILQESTETHDWQEYSAVISEIQSPTIRLEIQSTGDGFCIADIMLCEGNVPKTWTPAPNEIYTSGVKMDYRGLEVSRSGTSEKTAITNSEFAGYYNDEKIFSINKDETHIKKTIVDGELTIDRVKFIPYSHGEEAGLNITIID